MEYMCIHSGVHSLANQTCKSDTGKTNISSMKNIMVNKYTASFLKE